MRKFLPLLLSALLLLPATLFSATIQEDQQKHESCSYCGMDRVKFAQSRMLIEYADGSSVGTCSLHCAAVEFAISIDKTPEMIKVGDFNSKQLIDAETAIWVLGGKKPGVMTMRAKWAFSDAAAADAFVSHQGGSIISFEQAMEAAYADMYQDTLKIRNKRKMMKMSHAGKK